MDAPAGNAPSWLFSFVDLAFLLLIATTQLGLEAGARDLGEIRLPRLDAEEAPTRAAVAEEGWQVRVHPPASDAAPFELAPFAAAAGPGTAGGPEAAPARLDAGALRARLAALRSRGEPRPLLAPHADSRSEDLLRAAGAIEAAWPGRRLAAVERLLAPQ